MSNSSLKIQASLAVWIGLRLLSRVFHSPLIIEASLTIWTVASHYTILLIGFLQYGIGIFLVLFQVITCIDHLDHQNNPVKQQKIKARAVCLEMYKASLQCV